MSLEEIGEIGVELAKLPPDRCRTVVTGRPSRAGGAERVDERIAELKRLTSA